MKAALTIQAIVLTLALSGMTGASAATMTTSTGIIPTVVITAKRLSLPAKIRMTMQDVGTIARRIIGMQTKSTKVTGNLG